MGIKDNWLANFRAIVDLEIARTGKKSLAYEAVGMHAELSPDYVYQVYTGRPVGRPKTPREEVMARLAKAYADGRDADWINNPQDPITVVTARSVDEPNGLASNIDRSHDLVRIPQFNRGGAMGMGVVLDAEPPGIIKSWQVDREWVRLNVRNHTGAHNLCIVTGFGPSMRPKYNPGDPLLMDRGVTVVDQEGIFFFRVGAHGFIKQLQRIPTENGMIIRAKSFSKDYEPFDITAKMMHDFEVYGKILTVWKSEQV